MREKFVCTLCDLVFLPEDVSFKKYIKSKSTCIRCLLETDSEYKDLYEKSPDCYGKEHDASSDVCSNYCVYRKACQIQYIDAILEKIGENVDIFKATSGKNSYASHTIQLLRSSGKILHINDIAGFLEKKKILDKSHLPYPYWKNVLESAFKKNTQIVELGFNCYIWRGFWIPEKMGGRLLPANYKNKKEQLQTVDEIFKKIKKEESL